MCEWGNEVLIDVIEPRGGKRGQQVLVDSCIAERVAQMNSRGIVTINSCCGHGTAASEILVSPSSIPLLNKYNYGWFWPKDDARFQPESWWASRNDIVVVLGESDNSTPLCK